MKDATGWIVAWVALAVCGALTGVLARLVFEVLRFGWTLGGWL